MVLGRLAPLSVSLLLLGGSLAGCGLIEERPQPASGAQMTVSQAIEKPLSPEETGELLDTAAGNWAYGNGAGETALTIGSIFVFPPYAIYAAGNALLSAGGYREIRVTDALPASGRDVWNSVYDEVTAVPGKVNAELAGEKFRTREDVKASFNSFMENRQAKSE